MTQVEYTKTEFPINSQQGDIFKFFQATIKVPFNIDIVWQFVTDLKNVTKWHPHMFELSSEIKSNIIQKYPNLEAIVLNPMPDELILRNKKGLIDSDMIMKNEFVNSLNYTMRCHIYPIHHSDIYWGYNFFELSVTAIDHGSIITFERYCDPMTTAVLDNQRLEWYNTISDIAADISNSFAKLDYVLLK